MTMCHLIHVEIEKSFFHLQELKLEEMIFPRGP